ncbi:MAG: hypothetical protein ACRDHC_12485 [Actinomycetota bacterium]
MKRHGFDPVSFVFGLLFAFLAVFVLSGNTLADLYPLWNWTLPAMAAGLLVLLYGVRRLVASPLDRDAWWERSDESPVSDAPAASSGSETDEA